MQTFNSFAELAAANGTPVYQPFTANTSNARTDVVTANTDVVTNNALSGEFLKHIERLHGALLDPNHDAYGTMGKNDVLYELLNVVESEYAKRIPSQADMDDADDLIGILEKEIGRDLKTSQVITALGKSIDNIVYDNLWASIDLYGYGLDDDLDDEDVGAYDDEWDDDDD